MRSWSLANINVASSTAIAHRDAGHPQPGRATAIRLALDSVRGQRRRERARALATTARDLLVTGSSEALFGRRDAVLLLLTAAGLSYGSISELVTTDITIDDDDSLWIASGHRLRIDSGAVPGFEPAQVWRRWHEVLVFADRYPSTALILQHLRGGTFPDITDWAQRPSPVAAPIDRWGHMPFPTVAMSPDAIGDVVDAHRTGTPPRRTPARPPSRDRSADYAGYTGDIAAPESDSVSLDTGYYEFGVQARRRAHTVLAELPQVYDDVEDRIDALLARTLDLLEYHSIDPDGRADVVQSGPGSNGLM
ncbi:hypothetical protein CH253_18180 [Rhodococcus sp. 06-156-3C]|nr:hypothetical protein CH248_27380 [Rhodococcus sp. 06-156-4a]OZD17864.1 hypothetical protein CH253_18180 [Rhodococcus sp. 06-156-3C]OZD20590.1 hypothetical protein CH280_03335 [Rhodococcus sp. 06-156-4C]OZD32534.1 hypothetical protein CH284_19865 [Rhodococcus sp. 06-156-3]